MAFKIALSAGHGKYTAGKRCLKSLDKNETREWVLNDRIADKVEALLKNYSGYELLRVDDTTGAQDVLLSRRSDAANNFDADFYLAIHHNAGINGGNGGGIIAFVYTYASAASIEWQKALYNALIAETGLKGNRSVPLSKANLHECREPNMAAVLLELGFMDSATDVPIILTEKYADQCAKAIVDVIVEKGKLVKKATNNTSKVMYRVRKSWQNVKSQIGAFTSLENAKRCRDQAGVGYYVFDEAGVQIYPAPINKKSVLEIAKEVIRGAWVNGSTRKKKLEEAGYNYEEVQQKVNELL